MTTLVSELYDALLAAGVEKDVAKKAAQTVISVEDKEQLASKQDIILLRADTKEAIAEVRTEMHALESRLIKWNLGALLALTTIFSAIVKLF